MFIQVLIESSHLYGLKGVYNLASALKLRLTGFRPANCKKIEVSRHHTIGSPDARKINNMWHYNVVFTTTGFHVEEKEEEAVILLKKITFKDIPDGTPDGETIIVPETIN